MIAQHTLTHAIQYLREAIGFQRQGSGKLPDIEALFSVDPGIPCAAYRLAKRTFRLKRCGTLAAAIKDLEKQLEQP